MSQPKEKDFVRIYAFKSQIEIEEEQRTVIGPSIKAKTELIVNRHDPKLTIDIVLIPAGLSACRLSQPIRPPSLYLEKENKLLSCRFVLWSEFCRENYTYEDR
jgi:hypothetical protein